MKPLSKTLIPALLLVGLCGCSSTPTPKAPERTPFEQAKYEWRMVPRGSIPSMTQALKIMEPLAWDNDLQAQAWLADQSWRLVQYDASRFWTMKAAWQNPKRTPTLHHLYNSEGYKYSYLVGNQLLSAPLPENPTTALEKATVEYQYQWVASSQNFQAAHDLLLPLAEQGNAAAQTALGQIYLEGKRPIKKDPEKALQWLHQAADQKDPSALALLGTMYLEGFKVEKDISKSVQYLEESMALGHPTAEIFLAQANGEIEARQDAIARREQEVINDARYVEALALYEAGEYEKAFSIWQPIASDHRKSELYVLRCKLTGTGTEKNYGSAITQLQNERNEGRLDAMLLLGEVFETGLGTEVDLDQAKEEYARAVDEYYSATASIAITRISLIQLKAVAAQQPEYEESAQGIRLAYGNNHYERAYLIGEKSNGRYDAEADYVIGLMLYYGNLAGWGEDQARGLKRLGQAANNNHNEAMLTRANILLENNDTTIEAAKLIYNAAIRGNTEAAYQWGLMRLEGHRTSRNIPDAIEYLTVAAEDGNVEAMAKLGDMYKEGQKGTSAEARAMHLIGEPNQDPNYLAPSDYHAKEWWEKAAAKGHANSAYVLGLLRENVSDTGAAADYYEIAVRKDHMEAQYQLGTLLRKEYVMDVTRDFKRGTELLEKAAAQGHELAAVAIAPKPEVVVQASGSWKDAHRSYNYSGGNSSGGYSQNTPVQSSGGVIGGTMYQAYGGLNPWSQQYQEQRIMKDPSLGFQNRYNY